MNRSMIAIYGIDGSGKTAVSEHLARLVHDSLGPTVRHQFPNRGTPTGKLISDVLTRSNAVDWREQRQESYYLQTLMLANRLETTFAPDSWHVLVRWKLCGLVYGGADGLDMDWLRPAHKCLPDARFSIFLREDPALCRRRTGERKGRTDIRYEDKPLEWYQHLSDSYDKELSILSRVQPNCKVIVVNNPHQLGDAAAVSLKVFAAINHEVTHGQDR